jgi:hypothetical protein
LIPKKKNLEDSKNRKIKKICFANIGKHRYNQSIPKKRPKVMSTLPTNSILPLNSLNSQFQESPEDFPLKVTQRVLNLNDLEASLVNEKENLANEKIKLQRAKLDAKIAADTKKYEIAQQRLAARAAKNTNTDTSKDKDKDNDKNTGNEGELAQQQQRRLMELDIQAAKISLDKQKLEQRATESATYATLAYQKLEIRKLEIELRIKELDAKDAKDAKKQTNLGDADDANKQNIETQLDDMQAFFMRDLD